MTYADVLSRCDLRSVHAVATARMLTESELPS